MEEVQTLTETPADLEAYVQALHVALRLEEEGLWYYTLNGRRIRNPRGRAAFHILLHDERLHVGKREARLVAVEEALRAFPESARAERIPARERTANSVFSRGRELIDRDADEREVMRQGIAIEWGAHNFYLERSEAAIEPRVRLVYGDLALEERHHYDLLVAAYETMLHRRG